MSMFIISDTDTTIWQSGRFEAYTLIFNPITRGVFDQRSHAGGMGTLCPDSVKYITGREFLCENPKFLYFFMRLVGYLGMFRKSQEVWVRNYDPKGVNTSCKPNPGTLCPPPSPSVW